MEVKIVKIIAKTNVALGYKGRIINPKHPIWQQNDDDITGGAAAFIVGQSKPAELEITLQIPGAKGGCQYTLVGVYDSENVMFNGSTTAQESNPGYLVFLVSAQFEPEMFFKIPGARLSWRVIREDTGESSESMSVNFELYWLYGNHHAFFKRGVPLEILRELAPACWISGHLLLPPDNLQSTTARECHQPGIPAKQWTIAAIVNYCFFRNPPRYDLKIRRHHFTIINGFGDISGFDNIILRLRYYWESIRDPEAVCNCYDQAAVLQYYLKAVGIDGVTFCNMFRFGDLKRTYLVGWAGCNNPYEDKIEEIPGGDSKTSRRIRFRRHSFCCLDEWNTIVDSCIGPHIGKKDPGQYLDSVIYPPTSRGSRPTPKHIVPYRGVTNVDWSMKPKGKPQVPWLRDFLKQINYSFQNQENHMEKGIVCQWPDPRQCPALNKKDWKLFYEDIIPGVDEVLKTWRLKKNRETIHIDLYVYSGKNTAAASEKRLITLVSLYSIETDYQKGEPDLGPLSFTSEVETHKQILWRIPGNIVLDVSFQYVDKSVQDQLIKWLHQLACDHIIENLLTYMPGFDRITCSNKKPNVGEIIMVKVQTQPHVTWDFNLKGDGLRLFDETDDTLYFEALKESKNTLSLAAVDVKTLMVKNEKIEIKVSKVRKE